MTGAKSKIVAKAWCDIEFDSCSALEQHDNEKWFELGGVDIVVWGNEWTIYADEQAAIDYMRDVYSLSNIEMQ